ncbi:MAG: ribosomal RNA small subunit methyltransferase A [Nitrospira sp.]|nr:ribosomal RNA small subunit methyltransferase A [Nitrospira sp.]
MGDAPLPAAIKHLGQNFLIDPNIIRKIITLAELSLNDSVLEIGPGRGILTDALCQSAGRVTAIEIDPRLHAYLTERQTPFQNLTLVLGDAMTYPIEHLPLGTIVVANLPYYLSTPLLFRLLDQQHRFIRLVLMLQNEVADRLVAKSGSSAYGVLSLMAQYSAEITKAFKVSPQCFRPRPDVDSAVVLLRTKDRFEQMRENKESSSQQSYERPLRIAGRRWSIHYAIRDMIRNTSERHCQHFIYLLRYGQKTFLLRSSLP